MEGAKVRPMDPRRCRGSQLHHPGLLLLGKTERRRQPTRSAHAISSRKLPSSPRLAVADKLGHIGAPLRSHRHPVKREAVRLLTEISKVPEKD